MIKKTLMSALTSLMAATLLAACTTQMQMTQKNNPLLQPSTLQLQYPQFDRVEVGHYRPAFQQGMAQHLEEIEAITRQPGWPTFVNTLERLEASGQLLDRVARVFYALRSAHTNDDLNEVETEIAPLLSAHQDSIYLNADLFARINHVYRQRRNLGLNEEEIHLVEETRDAFIRAGAELNDADKERLKAINKELAELSTQFSQNVLNEVNDLAIVVDDRSELAGLNAAQIQTAADAAAERGMPDAWVLPLLNTSQQPPLASLENRELRNRILQVSLSRGHRGNEHDNRAILSRTAQLRAEKARLLGFANWAEYVLQEQTAPSVAAVNKRLAELVKPSVANARKEAADLQAMIDSEGGKFKLAAWDWDYYAEKLRKARYQFDESQLRPYFELNNVMQKGAFFAATQIFGITFEERFDLPVYQEDVRVFEVFDKDGSTLSLLIMDMYARSSKRGGAWMNAYVSQSHLLENKPVVANHLNIPKPPPGEPTLLTFDEVITLFHEFGHALHGMFSNVIYPSFAGTSVPRDFVEFPSQVNEMWADWPEVLANYALHHETGEPLPRDLLKRVLDAAMFNQGYATTEYLAASVIDLALHQLAPEAVPSADEMMQFEARTLRDAGFSLKAVPPRYRLPYFSHIMGGYSAGYYSYIWSEVLDADTVEWFRENGGMTLRNGQHFRDTLLSRGGSEDAMVTFRNFRGRDARVEPLLKRRGLEPDPS